MRALLLVLALVAISAFPFISNWYYGNLKDSRLSAQVEKIVEEYILENPEKILESVNKYRLVQFEEQQKQKAKELNTLVAANKEEILDTHYPSFLGQKEAVTVVEFFDASCGYCKFASQTLLKLKDDYPNVTFILRNLPILGRGSALAARYDTAVFLLMKKKGLQGSEYAKFYSGLMAYEGSYTHESLSQIISSTVLSTEEVERFMKRNEVEISSMIEATTKLAQKLHLEGTPVFIVGDQVIQGADEARLREVLEKVSKH